MNGALTGIVLALLWGIVVARFPTLWRDAQQRAMWATLFSLAVTRTVAAPGVNAMLGELTSEAEVIPHLLGVVTTFLLLRFVSVITDYDATHPHAMRYQLLLAMSVLAALILLINRVPGGIRTTATELTSTAITPAAATYWVILNGYLGTVLVIATGLFWRTSRLAQAGRLRNGLRTITTGILLVTVYAVLKTGVIVAHSVGVTMPLEQAEPAANALRTIGIFICLVGVAVPASGKAHSAIHAYRSLWALRPLWRVMRRTFPDLILFPRRRALLELAGVDEVQLRLYRRVIEIRDGMLTLRDYLPAGALADAERFVANSEGGRQHPNACPALVEACGIALALQRHRSGAVPTESGDRWADIGGEIADEVAWLSAVSAAFRRKEPAAFAASQLETAAT